MSKSIQRRLDLMAKSIIGGRGRLCNHCAGILEYVYSYWWKCRECGRWHDR